MKATTDHMAQEVPAVNSQGVKRDIIVIGASAGGVEALTRLFTLLPRDLPATIGCVLHRGLVPSHLAPVLGQSSSLPLREPQAGEPMQRGMIYLAPADQHLLFTPDCVTVQRGPVEHGTRPAIDPMFRSAAATYGERVVGVLLTGASQDGLRGMIAVSQSGGLTLVQHPDDAYLPYMALSALHGDDVKGAYPLEELPAVLATLAGGGSVAGMGKERKKS
jgi:two-component system chemotaxis response regulator CheB